MGGTTDGDPVRSYSRWDFGEIRLEYATLNSGLMRNRAIFCGLALAVAQPLLGSDGVSPPALKVFTTTMTQIVLQWEDPNPDTVSYRLQRDTDFSFQHNTGHDLK